MEGGILPSRQELLSRIELVCDLDSSFIALTGEPGIGKSTVLEYFVENQCPEHRKCFIQASSTQAPDHIKEQILLQLFTAQTVDTRYTVAQNARQNQFEELTQVIIIIDNGQFIDTLVFDELIELLKTPIDNLQASVIFALPDDRELFSALNAKHPLIEIHVELLNRAESRMLLEYYYSEMMDSDRQEVQRFIERCDGNPSKLLTWQSEAGSGTKEKGKLSSQAIVMSLAGFVLVAIVAAASWYFIGHAKETSESQIEKLRAELEAQQEAEKTQPKLTGQANDSDSLEKTAPQNEQNPANDVSTKEQVDKLQGQPLDDLLVKEWDVDSQQPHIDKAIAEAAAQEALEQQQKQEREAKKAAAKVQKTHEEQSDDKVVTALPPAELSENEAAINEEDKPELTQQQTVTPVVKDKPVMSQSDEVEPQAQAPWMDKMDNTWFMQQSGEKVILQLTGVSNQKTLGSYLSYHKLGDDAHVYQSMRNGKPWYVVTYGSYDSIAQANAAKAQLPVKVRSGQPWAKFIRTIQAEILNADKKDQ